MRVCLNGGLVCPALYRAIVLQHTLARSKEISTLEHATYMARSATSIYEKTKNERDSLMTQRTRERVTTPPPDLSPCDCE